MNNIETRPIGKLIRNDSTPNRIVKVEHYSIPSYQRGYRWTELHVKALLEDIDNFLKSQNMPGAINESYCLQPIVVVAQIDEDGLRQWELVDGQQRLTTLYLILKRLNRPHFEITFDKRPASNSFLSSLTEGVTNHDTPDFHFMSEAYRCIDNWFTQKENEDIGYPDDFANKLLNRVQVIWYEVALKSKDAKEQETEKIDIFNRLNIGKIPLEDAELVRALLMSHIEGNTKREKLMRQGEFSNEWYEIEQWLRNPEVWDFLTDKSMANHIQLLFELQAHNKNSENYNTYKWFEQEIRNSNEPSERSSELWKETKEIFGRFRYWYKERTLYHYVGFLLSAGKITLAKLLELSETDKKSFKRVLFSTIKNYLEQIDIQQLSYDGNQEELKRILLLFNVLSVERMKSDYQLRFPFNLYNKIRTSTRWSLEHIHAQQSQDPMQNEKAIREWIEDTLSSIEHIETVDKGTGEDEQSRTIDISEYKSELSSIMASEKIDKDAFNSIRIRIVEAFDSAGTTHALENMALLSCPDNSRLNNAIFPVKRDRIIQMEREGSFIPPCTRNVFLKLYSKADNQPYFWSTRDKADYIEEIENVFNDFKSKTDL